MDIKTLDDINKLIVSDAETDSVEYKETTGQLERGMETLCAFLNKDGGTVLFGINDKKKVIGQEVADTTKRNIADAINRLEPAAAVQITYIPIPNSKKKVIVLHVEDSRRNRPFSYKGRPYMRVESVTSTMPQSKYNELLLKREETRHGWKTYPNPELKLSDLDEEEIRKTVRLGIESGRLPEPEYRITADEVKLIFRYKPAGQPAGQPTKQVASLIKCLDGQTLSVREIMEFLALKGRDNFLKSYLYPALQDNLITQTHPEQANHPDQKYRLTDKGMDLLKKQ